MTFVAANHGGFFMSADENALSTIPSPEVVRTKLTQALREVQLLRSLLRLSEKAVGERQRRKTYEPEKGGARAV
jgi:hypothetical protein